jgi:hypothetical protein
MQEIVQFVSGAMIGGVVGNTTYDGLKVILGSSFDMLANFLSNNENAEFKGALTILLAQNEELKQQIIDLQQGKSVSNDNSVKVGGNNSGVIVTGNNNSVNRK